MNSTAAGKSHDVVDVACLFPGDVLLSTARAVTSAVIRKMISSEYSHATLHLSRGIVIQSTADEGVGFAKFQLVKAEQDPTSGSFRLFGTLPGASLLHVYRHASLVGVQLTVEQQIPRMKWLHEYAMTRYWGQDYARLSALAVATPFLSRATSAKEALLDALDRHVSGSDKLAPEPFCSQLVFEVLKAAGLAPAPPDAPSCTISPQALVDPATSNLRRVSGAEAQPDDSVPNVDWYLEQRRLELRGFVGPGMNAYRRAQVHERVLLDELQRLLNEHLDALRREMK